MFPISDSAKSGKIPFITLLIIFATSFVFYEQLTLPNQDLFIRKFALIPAMVNILDPQTLIPFVTAIFLHGGFLHILSNMWFLWIFGDNVEARIGIFKFSFLYIIAGIVGNFAHYILAPTATIPMLGASGAVSGVLGAYFVLFPSSNIRTFIFLLFFATITEIPAMIYIFYWFILQLFSGVASLPFNFQTGGIAFWAHVGGFLTGLMLARYWKKPKREKIIEGEIVG